MVAPCSRERIDGGLQTSLSPVRYPDRHLSAEANALRLKSALGRL